MWMLWKSPEHKFKFLGSAFIISVSATISLFISVAPALASENALGDGHFYLDQDQGQQCPFGDKAGVTRLNLTAQCLLSGRDVSGTQPVPEDNLIPKWANLTLFSIGQTFARKNIGYVGISHFFALMFENFIPDIKDVLLTTGSSNTRDAAVKRYTATAAQVILWYRNSLDDPAQRETILGSLRKVRRIHLDGAFKAQSRMKADRNSYIESKREEMFKNIRSQYPPSVVFDETFWLALEKDLYSSDVPKWKREYPKWNNSWGPPISQFAQSLTQFSFAGLPVLFHKELGISQVSRGELEGYVHMWAVLGYAIGIKDEFNICRNKNFDETKKLFRDILDSYFIPAMFQLDWRTRVQIGVYLDALHQMDQIITPRLITYRFLRDIMKIRPMNLFNQMNIIERMYLAVVDSLMSNNLVANRFLLNRGGMFFVDVNGYESFGSQFSTDARKSEGAFYTRDKLLF